MTERLYYDNAYLLDFKARVQKTVAAGEGRYAVYLDKSAFYPTSGGQPFDTGSIGGFNVIDVYVDDDGDVAHILDGCPNMGEEVICKIDKDRRLDHMQQHAGEHMLAGCIHIMLGGHTIGLHLGHADSSIDVELPSGRTRLEKQEIIALEDEVNRHIRANEPIKCFFPTEEELKNLPLRKAPAVASHIRVVCIGDWEYCACGGTHPLSTGEIGLLKIIDARPSKGKVRLTFLCGKRAFENYRLLSDVAGSLTEALSTEAGKLPEAINELTAKLKDAQYALTLEKTKSALSAIKNDRSLTGMLGDISVTKCLFYGLGSEGLKEAAAEVCRKASSVALLADAAEDGITLLFSRSQDLSLDMGALLKATVSQTGGKGGGKGEFARGFSSNRNALEIAYDMLKASEDVK